MKNRNNSRTFGKEESPQSQGMIRIAKPCDRDFICLLSDEAFSVYGPYREIIADWFDSAVTATFTAVIGNHPVAFSMLGYLSDSHYQNRMAEILAIAVTSAWQRKGVGQRLLRAMECRAGELHIKTLSLHTAEENLGARRLFLENGFKIVELQERYYPAGQTGLMMLKELSS